jgi:hypothetical protein
MGQTDARSTTVSTRKPQRFRNPLTWDKVVVLPAFGTPANSMMIGRRAFRLNFSTAVSARICNMDF